MLKGTFKLHLGVRKVAIITVLCHQMESAHENIKFTSWGLWLVHAAEAFKSDDGRKRLEEG